MEIAGEVCTATLNRSHSGNTITAQLVAQLHEAVRLCEAPDGPSVLVLTGSPEVFCAGGDFDAVAAGDAMLDPALLYDVWLRLATGPFVSLAVARGRVGAGGVGLTSACDIVLGDATTHFALSEMLFGLYPACVLPFLVRRIGAQRAHFMTLTTQSVNAAKALEWGLLDELGDPVDALLRKHLLRLKNLSKQAVGRYKRHMAELSGQLHAARPAALEANRAMFSDPKVRADIKRYVMQMKFPWEA